MGLCIVTSVAITTLVMTGALSPTGAGAQVPITIPGTEPTTTTTAPRTTTTTAPLLPPLDPAQPVAPVPTTPAPKPKPAPAPAPAPPPAGVPGNGAGDSGVVPADAGPFPPHLAALSRSVKRTGSRNTTALVDTLRQLESFGLSREEALRVGMGQFPVGGYANYSHDWWFPRFGPVWRLHQGTDIFAARGTPVRAPATGVIRWAGGGLGGIAAYVVEEATGTYFYLAHLDRRPDGQRDGQAVQVGDTVGYVGTSGNAEGGTPHLHFEYHPAVKFVTKGKGKKKTTVAVPIKVRPGTTLPAVDPKGFLDLSLQHAMANSGNLVATYRTNFDAAQAAAAATAATSVGALDAVAGATALGGVQAAAQLSPGETMARYPLAALAFMLMLLVGSLTSVLAPSRSALPGNRTRRRAAEPVPSGVASMPEPEAPGDRTGSAESGGRAGTSRRKRLIGVAARARRTPA